jgi:hypothetical protein
VGAAVGPAVRTAVVLAGRALAGTGVGRTLRAGHVVVVERHGSSEIVVVAAARTATTHGQFYRRDRCATPAGRAARPPVPGVDR